MTSYYFFDASALVKYYILEPGSTWVRAVVDAREPDGTTPVNTILIAEASIAESAAAFAVLYRVGRISKRVWDAAFRACMVDIASRRFGTVPVLTIDFQVAAELTKHHPLKAYDAVQLAVALRQNKALASRHLTLTFMSGDKKQLAAAKAEGFATDNPFDHISP